MGSWTGSQLEDSLLLFFVFPYMKVGVILCHGLLVLIHHRYAPYYDNNKLVTCLSQITLLMLIWRWLVFLAPDPQSHIMPRSLNMYVWNTCLRKGLTGLNTQFWCQTNKRIGPEQRTYQELTLQPLTVAVAMQWIAACLCQAQPPTDLRLHPRE